MEKGFSAPRESGAVTLSSMVLGLYDLGRKIGSTAGQDGWLASRQTLISDQLKEAENTVSTATPSCERIRPLDISGLPGEATCSSA